MKLRDHRWGDTLLESLALLCFFLFMLPFFLVLINASKTSLEIISDPVALPANPLQLFSNMKIIWENQNLRYPASLLSSFIITGSSLFCILLFSSAAAWVLVRSKTTISTVLFFLFLSGMIIPFQVVMFPLVSLFRMIKEGTGISMLRSYHGMVLAYIGFGVPLSIFMFHGFIKSIPLELEEAATIDGCSRPRIFFAIIVPVLKSIIVTVMILNGLWIWNDYLLPSLILGIGNQIQTLPLAVAFFVGSFVKKWDLILTATLMAAIPIITLFLFVQRYIIRGMLAGSIK